MDVLKPELIWVEGRCYRYYEGSAWANNRVNQFYTEDNCDEDMENEEMDEKNIEVWTTNSYGTTVYKHSFHVPKELFPFIIGSKHATRKRIESDTKTTLQIPKAGEDGDIIISGSTRKGVISARNRIDLIVAASRKKVQATHFLSIPLNTEEIMKNFEEFKKDVLEKYGKTARGLEENIFQSSSKLHCTMGILKLLDDDERKLAVATLNNCKKDVIQPLLEKHGPIKLKLEGLQIMNDDPAEARILYAKVDPANKALQEFVDGIVDYFCERGLMQHERNNVKIHITLLNTKFLNLNDRKITFDATEILNAHKDTFFGEITVNEIHLSQRHTKSENGYYQATATINFQE